MRSCEECPVNSYSTEGAGQCTECGEGAVSNSDKTSCSKF